MKQSGRSTAARPYLKLPRWIQGAVVRLYRFPGAHGMAAVAKDECLKFDQRSLYPTDLPSPHFRAEAVALQVYERAQRSDLEHLFGRRIAYLKLTS